MAQNTPVPTGLKIKGEKGQALNWEKPGKSPEPPKAAQLPAPSPVSRAPVLESPRKLCPRHKLSTCCRRPEADPDAVRQQYSRTRQTQLAQDAWKTQSSAPASEARGDPREARVLYSHKSHDHGPANLGEKS